jgi:hypothetical protein
MSLTEHLSSLFEELGEKKCLIALYHEERVTLSLVFNEHYLNPIFTAGT